MNISIFEFSYNQTKEDIAIGSNATNSSSGNLQIYITPSYGNKTYYAKIYRDNVWIGSKSVAIREDATEYFGALGAIMAGLIVLTLALMTISTGALSLIFTALGVVMASIAWLINMPYGTIIWLFCAIFIVIWKISSRRVQ